VTYRSHVHMRLRTIKLFLRHFSLPLAAAMPLPKGRRRSGSSPKT
jgi:hypothetical protein